MTSDRHTWAPVTMPDGSTGFAPAHQAADHQHIIDARHEFVVAYCTKRGWPTDAAALSFDQILEIRAQDGWKNAGKS